MKNAMPAMFRREPDGRLGEAYYGQKTKAFFRGGRGKRREQGE